MTARAELTLGDGLNEDTEVGLSLVEGLGGLSETSGKTVVDEGSLDDLLEGILDRHGSRLVGDIGDLDLGGGGVGSNVGSSVRHF
jgi:hypothetical protein